VLLFFGNLADLSPALRYRREETITVSRETGYWRGSPG